MTGAQAIQPLVTSKCTLFQFLVDKKTSAIFATKTFFISSPIRINETHNL